MPKTTLISVVVPIKPGSTISATNVGCKIRTGFGDKEDKRHLQDMICEMLCKFDVRGTTEILEQILS
jgi:hypothetical protein